MRRLLTGLGIAALLTVNVAQGMTASVPFERYTAEVELIRKNISIAISTMRIFDPGSESQREQLFRIRDVVDEGIVTLEEMGVDAGCYEWYHDTMVLSLRMYRAGIQADIDQVGLVPHSLAANETLQAAVSMEEILAEECAFIEGTNPDPVPDPLIQRMPLV